MVQTVPAPDVSKEPLTTRVALLEMTVTTLRSEFNSLERTIVQVGLMVVVSIFGGLIATIVYFIQQKDEVLRNLATTTHYQQEVINELRRRQ